MRFSVDSDCIHFGPGDCGVTFWPRITFTSTVRPAFGHLTSYLVCYGGCAKGRIKTEAFHWIVDAIKAAYTSQGWNAPFTLGSTQQGLSPSVRG